jgi:adenylate cyclase
MVSEIERVANGVAHSDKSVALYRGARSSAVTPFRSAAELTRWIHRLPYLFADLKRRRVFRVVAIYGAVSFAILQGVELIAPVVMLPGWIYRVIGAFLFLGMPVVVVLAWVYDFDGLRKTPPATSQEIDAIVRLPRALRWTSGFLGLGGLALLGITGWFALRSGGNRVPRASAAPVVAVLPMVAVLPFANRSALLQDGYFVDGLHDDILIELSRISALRVISGTSVLRFRNSGLSLRAIADSLGATAILEGAVQRSGDSVRISMQLIDVRTEMHLWAEQWDTELAPANLLAIQDTLAVSIATALKVSLAPEEEEGLRGTRTQDRDAYNAFLLGQSGLVLLTKDGLRESTQRFEEAVQRDPEFSEAWAGLAVARATLATFVLEGDAAAHAFAEADTEANRARSRRPLLAYALLAQGIVALGARSDPVAAQSLFRLAHGRRPGDTLIQLWYARSLMIAERYEAAVDVTGEILRIDPLSGIAHAADGLALWGAGHLAAAADAYRQAIELDPEYASPHLEYAVLLAQMGDEPRMRAVLVGLGRTVRYDRPDSLATVASAVFHRDLRPRAVTEVDRLLAETELREADIIPLLALLGADSRATAAAAVARVAGGPWVPLFRHPLFAAVRKVPAGG